MFIVEVCCPFCACTCIVKSVKEIVGMIRVFYVVKLGSAIESIKVNVYQRYSGCFISMAPMPKRSRVTIEIGQICTVRYLMFVKFIEKDLIAHNVVISDSKIVMLARNVHVSTLMHDVLIGFRTVIICKESPKSLKWHIGNASVKIILPSRTSGSVIFHHKIAVNSLFVCILPKFVSIYILI